MTPTETRRYEYARPLVRGVRAAHPTERAVGIAHYASDADGTGGRLRASPGDFRVREIEAVDADPVDADPGDYPHLVVRATLRDWDTNDFARELADRLGISRERVSWAGTKDKRAVTTQLFSVRGLDAGDLPPVRDADLEPVGRVGRPVLFGDLAGNAFEVTVADAERPDQAGAVTDDLRAFGDGTVAVPNYFGQQRFGSHRPITHAVGLRIVRGDWEGAVMTYLGDDYEAEPEGTRRARRHVAETRDWGAALDRFPRRLRYERAMLHVLADDAEDDFRAALRALPENLRRLFVNAAQSFAFNRIVSRRMERDCPLREAVAGDVVCFTEEREGVRVPDPDRTQRVAGDQVGTVNRHVERGRALVTAPLVGTDTELGDGVPGEIERAVLDDLGLAPADFDLPEPYGAEGTRRAVLARPADLAVEREPLSFSFVLPPGSYATVLLREYLKTCPEAMA